MKKLFIVSLAFFFSLIPHVFAATDDFSIRLRVINDALPPTAPVLLSVTPIAASQIDILWQAATDNNQVDGYVLFRDGVAIATTTLLSYSDTGLIAETLYEYELYAFDLVGNISSTSNALATTTLAQPVVAPSEPEEGDGTQSTQTTMLRSFSIDTTATSATLSWATNVPSRYSVRWGRYDTYLDGYVQSEIYKRDQQTVLTGLEPGVTYYFEVTGYTQAGRPVVLRTGQFTTDTLRLPQTVPNVVRLQAEVIGTDVRLTYAIPELSPPPVVRVVRNHLGFPIDRFDGALVYEGYDTSVLDQGALARYERQYYTVFLITPEGTVSSGAVVMAQKNSLPLTPGSGTGGASTTQGGGEGGGNLPVPSLPPVALFGLDAGEIYLLQPPANYTFLSPEVMLDAAEPFILRIPYSAVPEYLKAIIVTLTDPTDSRLQYSFLLKINADKSAYEATIAPLMVVGVSRLQIEIFDFERLLVGRYQLPITFVEVVLTPPVFFPDAFVNAFEKTGRYALMVALWIIFLWIFFWYRRKRTEDNR